jgi:hypothetical protein
MTLYDAPRSHTVHAASVEVKQRGPKIAIEARSVRNCLAVSSICMSPEMLGDLGRQIQEYLTDTATDQRPGMCAPR